MQALNLENVVGGELKAHAGYEDGRITACLRGNADLRAQESLKAFLPAIHAEAMRLEVREVVVDLRALEFMNSSCFKALVTWVTQVQELPEERRYGIRFRSSAQLHWQRRSLNALRGFAIDLIQLEVT